MTGRLRGIGVMLAVALLLGSAPRAARPATLPHLEGVNELKAWFNDGHGHARAIFLLSPT